MDQLARDKLVAEATSIAEKYLDAAKHCQKSKITATKTQLANLISAAIPDCQKPVQATDTS
ncbi:hypothetical protein I4U23_004930 [Adineta vaga]|nr:hypothetical protein I4U23_004930 [Adineta vaga]